MENNIIIQIVLENVLLFSLAYPDTVCPESFITIKKINYLRIFTLLIGMSGFS